MTQQSKTLFALPEDWVGFPAPPPWLTTICHSGQCPLLASEVIAHTWGTDPRADKTPIDIKEAGS